MTIFETALGYSKYGFSVIPVNGKIPLIKWEEFQTRRATAEEIKKWWQQWPDANVGIVTGAISGLVIVDIDSTDISITQGLQLPLTPVVRTSKGWHYYFKHPGYEIPNSVGIRKSIDIRGDKGFVVAPPSKHISGHQYSWSVSFKEAHIAPLPVWVSQNEEKKDKVKGTTEGSRNATAAELAGKLLRNFRQEEWEMAFEFLKGWNNRNNPPLEEKELRSVFDSIKTREEKRRKGEKKSKEELVEYKGEYRVVSTTELLEYLDSLPTPTVTKIPIPGLDRLMNGVEEGEMVVIGGLPGSGKTQLCTALTKLFDPGTCLWFSYEVTPRGLMARYNNNPPLFYIPIKHKQGDINWLEERIEEALAKHPTIKHIFIDCIDDLFDETRWKNPALEIGVIAGRVKNIAVEKQITVWMPSHVKKPDRTIINSEPRMGDIAHSGAIEHKADFSIYIQRVPNEYALDGKKHNMEYDGELDNTALIKVVKARRETAKVGKILLQLVQGEFRSVYSGSYAQEYKKDYGGFGEEDNFNSKKL